MDFNDGFEARSATGGNTVLTSVGAGDVDGASMIVRKSNVKVAKASGSSLLSNGSGNLYSATIAAEKDAVALKQLAFEITLTDPGVNMQLNDFSLIKDGTTINNSVMILENGSGNDLEPGSGNSVIGNTIVNVIFDGEDLVDAGQTTTYTLRASFTGVDTGDSVSSRLLGDTNSPDNLGLDTFYTPVLQTYYRSYLIKDNTGSGSVQLDDDAGNGPVDSNFIWSDSFDSPHDSGFFTSYDWINGFLVKDFPLESQVLSKN